MNVPDNDLRLAVLIDAENVPCSYVKAMLEEITRYGTPTIKRIYGDWTKPVVSGWKNVLVRNAITPIQQYSYTTGKNSSDSAMIIDAMDILYAGNVDGFCLVSSDSDFTRLATRLRESGKRVYGIGEKKTPASVIAACDKFIYLEIIAQQADAADTPEVPDDTPKKHAGVAKVDNSVIQLIANSVSDLADENGWAFLGEVGSLLLKKQPDFDSRNYGFSKLTLLIESTGQFELDVRENGHNVYVRQKPKEKKHGGHKSGGAPQEAQPSGPKPNGQKTNGPKANSAPNGSQQNGPKKNGSAANGPKTADPRPGGTNPGGSGKAGQKNGGQKNNGQKSGGSKKGR